MEPELPIMMVMPVLDELTLEEGDWSIAKRFFSRPALCTYYCESQSVVGKHNLEIMKDN